MMIGLSAGAFTALPVAVILPGYRASKRFRPARAAA